METKVKTEGSLSFNNSHIYSTYPTRYSEGILFTFTKQQEVSKPDILTVFSTSEHFMFTQKPHRYVCDSKYLESFIMQLSEEK